jgi:hypothetical protein
MISFAHFDFDLDIVMQQGTEATIDTTATNTIDVTFQWATADVGNTITLEGAETICVDANT